MLWAPNFSALKSFPHGQKKSFLFPFSLTLTHPFDSLNPQSRLAGPLSVVFVFWGSRLGDMEGVEGWAWAKAEQMARTWRKEAGDSVSGPRGGLGGRGWCQHLSGPDLCRTRESSLHRNTEAVT